MWQNSIFENTKMHYSQKCGGRTRQMHAADVHGRRTRQTCKAKTFDAIAASVKVEFPLMQLWFL